MCWLTWLRRKRQTQAVEQAAAAEAIEHDAARQRIVRLARVQPDWNGPTAVYRPLMTPGQAARRNGGRRP
jgi:hypothetical protein